MLSWLQYVFTFVLGVILTLVLEDKIAQWFQVKGAWKRWLRVALILFAIVGVIGGVAVGLPLYRWGLKTGHKMAYQDLGTWLQGVLTPVLIVIGLATWWSQKIGQEQANRIQVQNAILSNVHELYGKLNYSAAWVVRGDNPKPGTVHYGDLQEVDRLIAILKNKADETPSHSAFLAASYSDIVGSDQFRKLKSNLDHIIQLIDGSGTASLYDPRIFVLHSEMTNTKPE